MGEEEMKKFWALPIWFRGGLLLAMLPIINYGISLLVFFRCKASGAFIGDCSVGSFLLLLPSLLPAYAANLVFHFSDIISFDSPLKMFVALVVFWFLLGALGSIVIKWIRRRNEKVFKSRRKS